MHLFFFQDANDVSLMFGKQFSLKLYPFHVTVHQTIYTTIDAQKCPTRTFDEVLGCQSH